MIEKHKYYPDFTIKVVGRSTENREIFLLSIGSGKKSILLWSQMHGDEPTATMALFDIFNFFVSDSFRKEKEKMLKNVTIHFLPMLNPDGAEIFSRPNKFGIDINRDALELRSPEAQILKRVRDSLAADF